MLPVTPSASTGSLLRATEVFLRMFPPISGGEGEEECSHFPSPAEINVGRMAGGGGRVGGDELLFSP